VYEALLVPNETRVYEIRASVDDSADLYLGKHLLGIVIRFSIGILWIRVWRRGYLG